MVKCVPKPCESRPCLTRHKPTIQAVLTGAGFHPFFKGHTNTGEVMLVNLGRDPGRPRTSVLWGGRSCLSAGAETPKLLLAKLQLGLFCNVCLGLPEPWGSPGSAACLGSCWTTPDHPEPLPSYWILLSLWWQGLKDWVIFYCLSIFPSYELNSTKVLKPAIARLICQLLDHSQALFLLLFSIPTSFMKCHVKVTQFL